jgi:hypothetical protein
MRVGVMGGGRRARGVRLLLLLLTLLMFIDGKGGRDNRVEGIITMRGGPR